MATSHRNLSAPYIEYKQQEWGDLIYGTKQQLQALGLGIGLAFPGESNQPQKKVYVIDPRGFRAKIDHSGLSAEYLLQVFGVAADSDVYTASISFPGRSFYDSFHEFKKRPYAEGIQLKYSWGFDEYLGTAKDLIAAGLAEAWQFPGQPNMNKVMQNFKADRSISTKGHPNYEEGSKEIRKTSSNKFTITIRIPEKESEERHRVYKQAEKEWEARMNALPRPAPLTPQSVRSFIEEDNGKRLNKAKADKSFQNFLTSILKKH